ncbi:hypothetical protein NECID01_0274 [Nematocida sp. AWRm77]|nr:hypothetical protein NECID01_0274 [Nematocida sp. AWRm77]
MESSKECMASHLSEKEPCAVERGVSVKIVHNYNEETVLACVGEDVIEKIKKKAHELFGLSCVRLEVDRKPLVSPTQIFSMPSPRVYVLGVKNKCAVQVCRNSAGSSISISCKFCAKSFCTKHTLPEEHVCEQISLCKEEAAQENLKNLLGGSIRKR